VSRCRAGSSNQGTPSAGNTPKFACRTPGGRTIRVKYGDGSKNGNREIYSAVAAARLVWFLGFESDPIYPITIDCNDCPADPMSGTGPRTHRAYLATFQPSFKNVVIVDGTNPNQGWSWGEVDEAIEELPEGPVRARQRAHFDALTLLGVLLQHGDRKPQQQRLECRGALDLSAGDIHPLQGADSEAYSTPVFFEHPGATACSNPVIAIQDLGATFGGAGRATKGSTAKMNLQAWTKRPVFQPAKPSRPGDVPECRGNLTTSMAAGELARGNPRVGEAGRALLQDRLQQLTDAHLQALLTTARVDKLPEAQTWKDSRGTVHTGSDAWIAAFKDKVRQITEQRCAP
jgi:hypothetical protein